MSTDTTEKGLEAHIAQYLVEEKTKIFSMNYLAASGRGISEGFFLVSPQGAGNMTQEIPEKNEKEFTHFIERKTFDALNKGVDIEFDSKTTNGFKIGPKDGSYIISFSAQDFENYFKGYFSTT